MVAVVVALAIVLGLVVVRTVAVIDAAQSDEAKSAASAAMLIDSGTREEDKSAQIEEEVNGQASDGTSQLRSLNGKLLVAHALAIGGTVAVLLKAALPVSDASCTLAHQFMTVFLLVFDGAFLTFLLAKVDVTNGYSSRACWEKIITWITRVYAWGYLPLAAIAVAIQYEGGTNIEGTICVRYDDGAWKEDERTSGALGYVANNAVLIILFPILLLLFVRPVLAREGDNNQSGWAGHKGSIMPHVLSTIIISIAYLVAAIIVRIYVFEESDEDDEAFDVLHVTYATSMLAVLTFNEVSYPLGYVSAFKKFIATT